MGGNRKGSPNLTPEELDIIRKLYPTTPARIVANKVGRKTNLIYKAAERMGIKRQPKDWTRYRNGKRKFSKRTNGCWEWTASTTVDGYGVAHGKDTLLAHRQMYIDIKGILPPSLTLDHLCRNPRCINPDHLEPVPQLINVRRGLVTKISPEIARRIRDNKTSSHAHLARQFQISPQTVKGIRDGSRWME